MRRFAVTRHRDARYQLIIELLSHRDKNDEIVEPVTVTYANGVTANIKEQIYDSMAWAKLAKQIKEVAA